MKRITTFASVIALLGIAGNAFAQFTGGNLVVTQVDSGDTTKAPSGAAAKVRIIEYTRRNGEEGGVPTGQFYDLPITLSGGNHRLTYSGSAISEGQITISEDNKYLLVVGYDAAPGTANIATTMSAAVNRVVGRIDWTLPPATAIDTTTALNNVFSGGSISGATSSDNVSFFLSGNGGAQGGVATATLGATTGTTGYGGTAVQTVRDIRLFNGALFGSGATSGGSLYGVARITTGATNELPGFPTTSGPSSYGFYFLDADTLYVADDRNTTDGGIQKWRRVGATWQLAYTFNIPPVSGSGGVGARSLAGSPRYNEDSGVVEAQLYAVSTDNQVVTVTDSDPGAQFTVIDTGTLSKVFRGVEVIRPTTISVGGFVFIPGVTNIQIPVHVEFRPADGSPKFTRTVIVANDGTYTVDNIPAGKGYTLHVKADNTLAGNHLVNTFTLNDLDADVTLLPGDASNDNTIDNMDLGILALSYATSMGDSGFDARADFNNDGSVDNLDLALLANNYTLSGDQ